MPWQTNDRLRMTHNTLTESSRRLESLAAGLFCRCGIDHAAHRGDTVGGKASSFCVFLDCSLVRSEVHAINLVTRHVAVQPLNFRPHSLEHSDRLLRDCTQFAVRQIAGIRYFAFYNKLRHRLPVQQMLVVFTYLAEKV